MKNGELVWLLLKGRPEAQLMLALLVVLLLNLRHETFYVLRFTFSGDRNASGKREK